MDVEKKINTEILAEQFIPDHVFVYLAAGRINCYDGIKDKTFIAGEYFLARKNRLAKYSIENGAVNFEPVIVCFDEAFLKRFQVKHKIKISNSNLSDTFIEINKNKLIPNFIVSLQPYYDKIKKIEQAFEAVKNEELLIVLLKSQPELADVLFNFGIPEKADLEEFMNRNFKFNVSVQRFSFLTGRSLSSFKREFKLIFNDTPNHWLIKKRLEEAYFLMSMKNNKPSDIYLDLGFEDLSHFSYAFKKLFGQTPTELREIKKTAT